MENTSWRSIKNISSIEQYTYTLCYKSKDFSRSGGAYTLCEPCRTLGGATHFASLCEALAEQSAAVVLASELADPLRLDYHGPKVSEAQKQKRDNREGYLSFVGGERLTKVETEFKNLFSDQSLLRKNRSPRECWSACGMKVALC